MPVERVLMTADAVGGVWTHSLRLAAELTRHGTAVDLATMGPPPDAAQRAAAARIPGVTLHVGAFKLEWMDGAEDDVVRAGVWLRALADAHQPDVVHLNGYAHAALPFAAPKVVGAHSCVLSWWRAVHREPAPPRWRWYADSVRRGLDGADHVVAPTAAMLEALVACHGRVRAASVIPNGVTPPPAAPPRKRRWILSAGRLWDEAKNLAALTAIAPEIPWPIRVAGDRALEGGAAADPCGVMWLGRLDDGEMAAAFADAAIYALPARYEPFGLSILEAAMHGCALVLGDIDSLRENWSDAALFVAPDDRAALATALRRLIDDPDLRAGLADAARRRSREFSAAAMGDRTLELYRTLARDRRRQGGVTCAS
jgi:glycosyltransferase involved in cell wall biosynthesis